MLLLDSEGRIVALFAARPVDDKYEALVKDVSATIESARKRCKFTRGQLNHRRGHHAALSKGASHGGGSKVCLQRSSLRAATHHLRSGARHLPEQPSQPGDSGRAVRERFN